MKYFQMCFTFAHVWHAGSIFGIVSRFCILLAIIAIDMVDMAAIYTTQAKGDPAWQASFLEILGLNQRHTIIKMVLISKVVHF